MNIRDGYDDDDDFSPFTGTWTRRPYRSQRPPKVDRPLRLPKYEPPMNADDDYDEFLNQSADPDWL